MLDLGWTELLVIGAIALVVVGPKDLPRVLRYLGYWMGKARSMAREFQRAIDQYAKEADLDDVKKAVQTPSRLRGAVKNAIDPKGAITKDMAETEAALKQGLKEAGTETAKDTATPSPAIPAAASDAGTAAPAQRTPQPEDDKPKAQTG